jgi:hypothetical protein
MPRAPIFHAELRLYLIATGAGQRQNEEDIRGHHSGPADEIAHRVLTTHFIDEATETTQESAEMFLKVVLDAVRRHLGRTDATASVARLLSADFAQRGRARAEQEGDQAPERDDQDAPQSHAIQTRSPSTPPSRSPHRRCSCRKASRAASRSGTAHARENPRRTHATAQASA